MPEKKSDAKNWAGVAGTVAVVGVGAAYSLTGGFGTGDPQVGDCVKTVGETAPAEDSCVDFGTTEIMLWSGDMVTEPGTIFCAAAV